MYEMSNEQKQKQLSLDKLMKLRKEIKIWEPIDCGINHGKYRGVTENDIVVIVEEGSLSFPPIRGKGEISAYFNSALLGIRKSDEVNKVYAEISANYHQRKKNEQDRNFEEGLKLVDMLLTEWTE